MYSRPRKGISFVIAGVETKGDTHDDGKKMSTSMLPVHNEFSDLEDEDDDADDNRMEEHEQDTSGKDANLNMEGNDVLSFHGNEYLNVGREDDLEMDGSGGGSLDTNEDLDLTFKQREQDVEHVASDHADNSSSKGVVVVEHGKDRPTAALNELDTPDEYAKYGIGALLMRKMGYEDGKGLGNGSSGIVAPLDAQANKGRLGVGGKPPLQKDKESKTPRRNSGEGKYKSQREVEKLISRFLNLTMDFSDLGVDVPIQLREWAGQLNSTATENDIDRIKYEYAHLEELWNQISQLNEQEEALEQELEYTSDDGFGTVDYEQLLPVVKKWEELSLQDPSDAQIQVVVEQLLSLYLPDSLVESIIVTILHPRIDSLASIPLNDYEKQQEIVVATLNKYTEILKPEGAVSTLFYRYLLERFSCKFEELLENNLLEGVTGDDNELVAIISLWLDEGNRDFKEGVFMEIARTVIAPHFETQVHRLDFLNEGTSFEQLCYLLRVIYLVGLKEDFVVERAIHYVASEIESYLNSGQSAVWFKSEGTIKLQIPFIMKQLLPELKPLSEPTWSSLQETFKVSFISWIRSLVLTPTKFEIILDLSELLPSNERFLVLQLLAFNSWIVAMIAHNRLNPTGTPSWYAKWYLYFAARLKHEQSQQIIDLVHWYLSKALEIIKSHFDSDVTKNLPRLEGELFPTSSQLLRSSRVRNVNGTATYRLQTSFRNVIQDYCMKNNILVEQLKSAIVRKRGLPILRFQKAGIDRYGYIDADVLWIAHTLASEEKQYQPISLDDLAGFFKE
ncbi:hypothetical protein KGF57_000538 [Candida theae]|uniref:G-patch domain-containing protein n=1 Tax=Candida theae TaxID=1198502 RepID=A0AAD5BJ02_9ASCO|nr:uncharacterized protein KGF57_000538 [Candida theae]KAI5967109.1 hypothetical protein KGF57_000538 [Candida theae]